MFQQALIKLNNTTGTYAFNSVCESHLVYMVSKKTIYGTRYIDHPVAIAQPFSVSHSLIGFQPERFNMPGTIFDVIQARHDMVVIQAIDTTSTDMDLVSWVDCVESQIDSYWQ